jgi:two-component system, cell cycle sensor histidine kinase and response regulator CckA
MGGENRVAAGTILVVDDDPAVLTIVARMLERGGYTTHVAPSGEVAEEILEREGGVDLIVTDVQMPGISGPDLVRRARARCPNVKAVYISGFAEGQPSPPADPEVAPLLEKPFDSEELLRAVGDALAGG